MSEVVNGICEHAFQEGLSTQTAHGIIEIVSVKNELDQTSITNLVKNLYPSEKVSSESIIALVNALGQGGRKPSLSTQSLLVKWLVNVYDVLEQPATLSRLYGVLFAFLDMATLRSEIPPTTYFRH